MKEHNYRIQAGLSFGLRRTDKNRRGVQALVKSDGMYPDEGALVSLEELSEIDISSIDPTPVFPYPQIFELSQINVLFTATQVYEINSDESLTLLLGELTEGHIWSVADFGDFIAACNGQQFVYRDPADKEWHADDPYGMSSGMGVCNFRGQAIVCSPNVTLGILTDMDFEDGEQMFFQDGSLMLFEGA